MQFGFLQRIANLADGFTLGDNIPLDFLLGDYYTFVNYQKASKRRPTFSVITEVLGDITGDVESVDCDVRISDTLHQPSFGHGNIVISDPYGIYSDGGQCKFELGFKVNIFSGYNDLNIPIWSGMITSADIDTSSHTINIGIAQSGYKLGNPAGTTEQGYSTSGDFSAYNTPKLLVDHLMDNAGLPAVSYENETGQPSDITFGETWQDNNRTFWAMIYGACFNIFYLPYFDINGILHLVRRESFTDVDWLYDDSNTVNIRFLEQADIVNHKIIDYGHPVKFEFTLGDNVLIGQSSRSKTDSAIKSRWGERSDYETDPLVGTWTRAGVIIDEILDYYPYMKLIYEITSPGVQQLELLDRIRVKSLKQNIEGKFIVLGRSHSIRPGYYQTKDIVISPGERF